MPEHVFRSWTLLLDYLEPPGCQAQLMLRVRFGRLCRRAQRVFPGDVCAAERRPHETLELIIAEVRMFQSWTLVLAHLEHPGSQAQLMLRVRLGRLCSRAQGAFPGDVCAAERRAHEVLEDEIFGVLEAEELEDEIFGVLEVEELDL